MQDAAWDEVLKAIHSWICDDYLVGESGVTERLHRSPERIFELG